MRKRKLNKKSVGFTLIELLISVSVIAILSGITFTVLNPQGLRSKSRDKQRIADLKRLQAALEMYFADNRQYPVQTSWSSVPSTLGNYLDPLPEDPSGSAYQYKSGAQGVNYCVNASMENTGTDAGYDCGQTECSGKSGGDQYCVTNP